MNVDFAIAGALGTFFGTIVAAIADGAPARRVRLQYWGGALFIGGIALLAFALPMI